jgi:uncharacterized protein DUF3592
MATTSQEGMQPAGQRSGRQLVAFGLVWLAVLLLILSGWLATAQAGRLLRWTKADAEVQRSEVYRIVVGSAGRRSTSWGAAVTIRYRANGRSLTATVDRGFQSAIRPWMEHWAGQYRIGSHRTILFNPVDPLEADLNGEWSLTTFSSVVEFGLVAAVLWWGSRRLSRVAPHN